MKAFLEEAQKLIRIRSTTPDGNEEIANYCAVLMENRGFKVQLQQVMHSLENVSKRQFNLIGTLGDPLVDRKLKKGLMLVTHLDTVSPGNLGQWTETGGDPFQPVVKDGKIYGLGSADVKLDFLCKLFAVDRFREKHFKIPLYLVGSCGEEMGMFGTRYLLQSKVVNPKYVVVGEPSELRVVYAHKCMSHFRGKIEFQTQAKDPKGYNRHLKIRCHGRTAHGSYPDLGRNAILGLVEFLRQLMDQSFEFRLVQLQGGRSINQVPDFAEVELFLASHQFEDFKVAFSQATAQAPEGIHYEMEYLGSVESGVRFLPEEVWYATLDMLEQMQEIAKVLSEKKDSSYRPDHSTMNIGLLRQTSNGLEMVFDFRVLPELSADALKAEVEGLSSRLSERYPQLNLRIPRERMNPGLGMTVDHDLVRYCKDAMDMAGISPELDKKATSTEAAQFFAAGYEAIVFGPGVSHGNSHSPNEHNLIEHLEKAIHFYEKLIERICL